ncbi:diadenylate cyclase CdaA [Lacticaseibacillus pabuli]|uniref:Diadenylate cyclase n=1 Tax=Lacticaseibacillus pabuli TaxID=3025672 RepID=A0ABY7WNX5_9LACO|nr:diadenylate cyclase CdaA [Lacticaseibacillus sp. KACC 23028]WDF81885.1 diadenylate cyclase CdaA [Lacticaseibacillus sp. KACC 23028]
MSEIIHNILTWTTLSDLVDIVVVWYLLYRLIMLLRGTKAVQLFRGILVIAVVRIIAWYARLSVVGWLIDQIINWSVVAIVIIFQPEIRRGLEHIGRGSFFLRGQDSAREQEIKMVGELDKAIQYMSKRRIGALITIQRNTGLEEYIETGITMDAAITGELLINTFIPNTPLHDGAVIIRDNRIAVAAAYLPLSESSAIPKNLGTRHRAAVGISEVTDAVTIVVSEETGGVTITNNSHFMVDLSRDDYLKFLNAQLVSPEQERRNPWQEFWHGFTKKGAKK